MRISGHLETRSVEDNALQGKSQMFYNLKYLWTLNKNLETSHFIDVKLRDRSESICTKSWVFVRDRAIISTRQSKSRVGLFTF